MITKPENLFLHMLVSAERSAHALIIMPPHDKTNNVAVCPAKTQESALCAQCVAKDPGFLHADSGDSDQTGRMRRLIWVFAGRTLTLLVLSCCVSFDDNLRIISTLHKTCCWYSLESPWQYYTNEKPQHMSHVMRKPVYAICEQQRHRSACTSAQSDQQLCCLLPG